MTHALTITNPVELALACERVFGFYPGDSLAVIPLGRSGDRPASRVDHPHDNETLLDVVAQLGAVYRRYPGRVVVASFTDNQTHALDAITALTAILDGIADVAAAVWVTGDQVLDVATMTTDTITRADRDRSHAEAAFCGQLAPKASRAAVAATLEGDPRGVAELVTLAEQNMRDVLTDATLSEDEEEWLANCAEDAARNGDRLSDGDAARLIVGISVKAWRDRILRGIDRKDAAGWVTLWSDMVRRSPEEWVAAPAASLALAAWLAGDGALARIAVERAGDPELALVKLVTTALDEPIPPSTWDHARAS